METTGLEGAARDQYCYVALLTTVPTTFIMPHRSELSDGHPDRQDDQPPFG